MFAKVLFDLFLVALEMSIESKNTKFKVLQVFQEEPWTLHETTTHILQNAHFVEK